MPWYLHIALRHLFPKRRMFSGLTFISLLGVSVGVAALIAVMGIFTGFGYETRERVSKAYGDLRVVNYDIIDNPYDLVDRIQKMDGISDVAPFAAGKVMLQYRNRPIFPNISGYDLSIESQEEFVRSHLVAGSVDDLDDGSVVVSSGVARSVGLRVGSEVDVYSPLLLQKLKADEILLPQSLIVAGIFETGWEDIDEDTIVCTLRLMQELYGLEDSVHGVMIDVKDGYKVRDVQMAIESDLGPSFRALSWMDINSGFAFALKFEKTMMFFILFIIVFVAAFSITASLLISVIRKTREIGLYSSMGAGKFEISLCFLFQGLIIGVVGTAAGWGLGFLVLYFRNDIVNGLSNAAGLEEPLTQVYGFIDGLPVRLETVDLVIITVGTILISMIAGVIPAFKASRMKPAEAMRSE